MRLLITGGGSGGHVNPALAIADTIAKNEPGSEIAYVGTPDGIENKLVPKAGYRMYHVKVERLRRRLTLRNVKAAYYALTSPAKAKKIIREFKPDLVVGTGGYVSWPIVKAASKLHIPTALHESNALPGVAVRMLAKHVDLILTTFDKTGEYLKMPDKTVKVGNPVLGTFASSDRAAAKKRLGCENYAKIILSYGGSLGAEAVNDATLELMRDYTASHPDTLHIHATGALEYAAAKKKYDEYGLGAYENCVLLEYIYDMPDRMASADVVICRAGSMTISELAAAGRCAVMIPSPHVAENHQYVNAKVLADAGAARLIEEKDLAGGRLVREVASLLGDDAARRSIERAVTAFAALDSNKRIYEELTALIRRKKRGGSND